MFVLYSPTKQNIFNYWGNKGKNMIKTMKISVNDDVKYVLNGENILFMQIEADETFSLFYDNYRFGFNSGSLTVSPTYNGALVGTNMINTAYQVDLNDSAGNQKSLISSNFSRMLTEIKDSFYNV